MVFALYTKACGAGNLSSELGICIAVSAGSHLSHIKRTI